MARLTAQRVLHETPSSSTRAQGKRRQNSEDEEGWSWVGHIAKVATTAHSRWLYDYQRSFMGQGDIRRRAQSYRPVERTSLLRALSPSTQSRRYPGRCSWTPPAKRHASSSPAFAPHAPHPIAGSTSSALDHFRIAAALPDPRFDPESAWKAYVDAQRHDRTERPYPQETLAFADRLVTLLEERRDPQLIQHWRERLHALLRDVAPDIEESAVLRQHSIAARTYAAIGDIDDALTYAHRLAQFTTTDEDHILVIRTLESVLFASWYFDGPRDAFVMIMEHWDLWYSYIHWRRDLQYSAPVTRQALSFLELVYDVIEVMGSPVTLLQQARSHWDKQTRDRACELLIQVFCQREMGEHALGVLDEMQDQGLDAPVRLKLRVVRALVKSGKFELANPLFSGMAAEGQRFRFYHSTGLSLFAHQGNASDAIRFYDHIHRFFGGVSNADKALLLHAHAVNGDTENVTRLFADLFQNSKSSAGSPTIYHYTAVILAHVQRGDFEGLNAWLERMSRAGIQPDVYVYTVILKSFANRKDVDSLAAVLDQMHEAGLPPNAVSYTTVVKTLADRKDPITAEAIYKRAISEGIVPDWRMIAALMNAHVEAGSWRGVIRAFDYLKQSPTSRISLNIDIYNTLLKAYVFIGAPYRVVSAIFHKLNEAGLRPDRYTFALLIQSACDANLMDIASSIFVEMDRLSEQWHSDLHINAYVMTIIMAGYLRRGDKLRAKAVYDDMRTRGIQPTSVTFGTILKAYGGEGTEESMKIAESFLSSLMAEGNDQSWMHIERSRAEALEDVYAPLMGSYRRRDSPADVERLFQRLLDAGGEPTLGTLTMLMDAYRRTRNLESVQQVWPQIFQMALRYSRVDALFPKNGSAGEVPRRQSNVLCVPLSIYIDALSMAGQHNEVAGVWHKLQVHGFSFDSHNWNHLVVALVRAGEPELAFEVVERVILPYQDQARQLAEQRNDKPDSPLFYDDAVDREETVLDLPSESPLRRSKRRREMVKRSTRKTRNLLDLSENEEQNFDYAHPLHILQQVSIQWNQWRPHGVTIGVLSNVLEHLESGSIVQPIRPPGEDPPPVTDSEQEPWSRAAIAREQLSRIYSDYPRTVMAIDEYLRAETRGLQKNRHKIS